MAGKTQSSILIIPATLWIHMRPEIEEIGKGNRPFGPDGRLPRVRAGPAIPMLLVRACRAPPPGRGDRPTWPFWGRLSGRLRVRLSAGRKDWASPLKRPSCGDLAGRRGSGRDSDPCSHGMVGLWGHGTRGRWHLHGFLTVLSLVEEVFVGYLQ